MICGRYSLVISYRRGLATSDLETMTCRKVLSCKNGEIESRDSKSRGVVSKVLQSDFETAKFAERM